MARAKTNDGDFTLAGYGDLLGELAIRGYVPTDFIGVDPNAPHLVLRHDVDFDLEAAVTMAEFESDLGVRASYFVLLRTEFYNAFSKAGRKSLGRLIELGHDVGLHFDASLHEGGSEDLSQAARLECDVLGRAVDREIGVFSFHRPPADLLDREFELAGVISAYSRRLFRDMGYCSDSRGAWHHGHPLDHPAIGEGRALQLLTHPIWWTAPESIAASDKVASLLDRRAALLDNEAVENCAAYTTRIAEARMRHTRRTRT